MQSFLNDPEPRYRGNMSCWLYNKHNVPLVTIGPHWKYVIGKAIGIIIYSAIVGIISVKKDK